MRLRPLNGADCGGDGSEVVRQWRRLQRSLNAVDREIVRSSALSNGVSYLITTGSPSSLIAIIGILASPLGHRHPPTPP